MAISLKTAGTWARLVVDGTVTIPGSPAAGDRMFLFAAWKTYTITVTNPTDWTPIGTEFADGVVDAGTNVGSVKVMAWYKDWESGDTAPTIDWSANPTEGHAVIMLWQKGSSEFWGAPTSVTAAISAAISWTATSSATISIPNASVVMELVAFRDDSATMTRSTTTALEDDGSPNVTWNGNYVESPATHFSSTTGQDMSGDLGHRLVTTGAAGVNLTGTGTLTASETGAAKWIVQALQPYSFGQAQALIKQTYPITYAPFISQLNTLGYVAHYRLGESSGSVIDRSATANHGTVDNNNGTVVRDVAGGLGTGQDDGAIGIRDFGLIDIPHNAVLNFGDTFTIGFGYKRTNTGGNRIVYTKGESAQATDISVYFSNLGFLRLGPADLSNVAAYIDPDEQPQLNDGNWHFAVITKTAGGNTGKWYLDGVDVTSATGADTFSDNSDIAHIAGNPAGSERFDGDLDEFFIANTAYTAPNVLALYNAWLLTVNPPLFVSQLDTLGYVGHYRLGEPSGSVIDRSVTANHGTVNNDNGTIVRDVTGGLGNGQDEGAIGIRNFGHVDIAHNAVLNIADTFTIGFGFKRAAGGGNSAAVWCKGSGATDYYVYFSSTDQLRLAPTNTGAAVVYIDNTEPKLTDDAWHFAVVTKSGATAKWYLDGVDVTQVGTNVTFASNSSAVFLGSAFDSTDRFNGDLDEFFISNTAFTAKNVVDLYNSWLTGAHAGPFGQAQADIISGAGKKAFGQAQSTIKQIYRGFGQSQGSIKQTYRGFGQAQADIKQTYNAYGQAQSSINAIYNAFGQSQAQIKALGVNGFGQAQAQVLIISRGFGQAAGLITYGITSSLDTFSRTLENQWGTADIGGPWTMATGHQSGVDGTTGHFAEGIGKVAGLRQVLHTNSEVVLKIKSDNLSPSFALRPISNTSNSGAYANGAGVSFNYNITNMQFFVIFLWDNGQAYNFSGLPQNIKQIFPGEYIWIKARTYFTSTEVSLSVRLWKDGQTEPAAWQFVKVVSRTADSTPGFPTIGSGGSAFGQNFMNVDYWQSYETYQFGFGQAAARITTTTPTAQAQALITNKMGFGQAQAKISAFGSEGFGQAQALINNEMGFGQSQAKIRSFGQNVFGNAQAYIRKTDIEGFGQAQAYIVNACYSNEVASDIPISYWRLAEATGNIRDSVGANHGTIIGGTPTYSVTGALADTDTAITFDGATEFFTIPDNNSLDLGDGPYSIEFWAKRAVNGTVQVLYYKGGQGDIYFDTNNTMVFGNTTQASVGTSVTTTDTNWHHYVVTRLSSGAGNTKIYKDAVDVSVDIVPATTTSSNTIDLSFGYYPSVGFYFNGSLDEIALYNYVLTPAQILNHYASKNTVCPVTYAFGQVQARIKQTYRGFGQAQSTIKQTYNAFGQAQTSIKQTYNSFGQAQARIKATSNRFGQAQAQIVGATYVVQYKEALFNDGLNTGTITLDNMPTVGNTLLVLHSAMSTAAAPVFTPGDGGASTWILDNSGFVGFNASLSINRGFINGTPNTSLTFTASGSPDNFHFLVIEFAGQLLPETTGTVSGTTSTTASNTITTTRAHSLILHWFGSRLGIGGTFTLNNTGVVNDPTDVTLLPTLGVAHRFEEAAGSYTTDWALGASGAWAALGMSYKVDSLQKISGFGQSQAQIKSLGVNRFGQSQGSIKQIYNSFGQSQGYIKSTVRAYGQAQGTIKQTYNAFGQAQGQIKQTYNSFGQAQSNIKAIGRGFGQAQGWIEQTYNGFGQAQGSIKQTYNSFGQAQSSIKQVYQAYGQAQANIKAISNAFGNAQADIKQTYQGYGNAQASIKQVYNDFGQAQGSIKQIYQGYGQAQGWIEQTYNAYGQAQGQIKQTYNSFGQAQGTIKQVYNAYGQSQGKINAFDVRGFGQAQAIVGAISLAFGQAQAKINSFGVNSFGQAQSDIKATSNVYGQAQACIRGNAFGQAQADIKQTYQSYGQSQGLIKQVYDGYGQSQATIKQTYNGFGQAQGTILQTYQGYGTAQADILQTYNSYGNAQGTIKQVYNAFGNAQGTILQAYNAFGQAQANIKQAYQGYGNAQGTILQTYYGFGQAQGYISGVTNVYGNAQGTIKATSNAYGQAQGYILGAQIQFGQAQGSIKSVTYAFGNVQADIKATSNVYGQAQGSVKATYNSYGQSQGYIVTTAQGYGQSQGSIKAIGQGFGQSQGDIKATSNSYGQAQSDIKQTYQGYGNAQALILVLNQGYGNAQGTIKTIYNGFGQSQGNIKQTYQGYGNAQSDIKATSNVYGQAQGYILTAHQGYGQAQGYIRSTAFAYGQAQALIFYRLSVFGQAQAFIQKSAGYGQAQAFIVQSHTLQDLAIDDYILINLILDDYESITLEEQDETLNLSLSDRLGISLLLSDRESINLHIDESNY